MHTNELNDLKPRARVLLYDAAPETAGAIQAIDAALATLTEAFNETVAKGQPPANHEENIETRRLALGLAFEAGPLRKFHEARLVEARKAAGALARLVEAERLDHEKRGAAIGVGLGRMMSDEQAGRDLCGFLLRLFGGFPVEPILHQRAEAWAAMVTNAERVLRELPGMAAIPPQRPDLAAQTALTENLKSTIEGK